MSGIFLGLGSNVGDRLANLRNGLIELSATKSVQVVNCSSVYETEPVGYSQQPWFLNMAVEIDTQLDPFQLLRYTQRIEMQIGRRKTFRWGPRIIDIDLLYYRELVIHHPRLEIPHRRLRQRRFVLLPLQEIAAQFLHPGSQQTVADLVAVCPDNSQIVRFMSAANLLQIAEK
ncbi:MAG: 2-amino-4-hydroxy-6-hydroxymethyldihydropteridine diphosphokinase [candidate division KSB1 bacterium]|nr:2-amino-4-hydroxy-6-hydroxymethyldihydropteridine diphosphokinase [candidate division KSB1 bacterium]MDZ7319199.1 2-amino-4-hydroxy-6-hydroxymethyldihydropteridine diphosphokinase [candidate division KSB1 bacterium]MDZ7340328.1 2-amino-4-hydroxy-6-hydroxymethyldihydropteridine diphosphokinase [candidate division KSB1 bacterium]